MDPDPNWAKFLDPDLMYLDGSTLLVWNICAHLKEWSNLLCLRSQKQTRPGEELFGNY